MVFIECMIEDNRFYSNLGDLWGEKVYLWIAEFRHLLVGREYTEKTGHIDL